MHLLCLKPLRMIEIDAARLHKLPIAACIFPFLDLAGLSVKLVLRLNLCEQSREAIR